ncbi:MAG: outer membrane protein assembly factor BamE domain-containing protein [Nitrospiraceae bacterium]
MNQIFAVHRHPGRPLCRRAGLTISWSMIVLLATGCAFVRGNYGEEVHQGDISAIKKGVSTRADVADLLGAPDRIVEANGHEIFHYFHYDMKSGTILLLNRTNIKSDDVFVIFDKNGVVEEVVAGKKRPELEFQFWPFGS